MGDGEAARIETNVKPIHLEPIVLPLDRAPVPRRLVAKSSVANIDVRWTDKVADSDVGRVQLIARAVKAVQTEWHPLFLALAGGLLSHGVKPDALPAFIRGVSAAAGDTRTEDRETAARTTAQRRIGGRRVAGMRMLREQWPAVAEAVELAFAPVPVVLTAGATDLETASREMAEAIRRSGGDGLLVVKAECGIGKTYALEIVAVERESSAEWAPDERRAPPHTKTSISVPTHALAIQTTANLRRRGARPLRIFSPFSMRNEETNEYECKYREIARHLIGGAQSGQWELCEGRGKDPCMYRETCRAAEGRDGPDNARIVVGPHKLIARLDGSAGATGLLGVDEPSALIETEVITEDQFARTVAALPAFSRRYQAAMKPALRALFGYMRGVAEHGEEHPTRECVQHGADFIDAAELDDALLVTGASSAGDVFERAIACVREAHHPDHHSKAPPIERYHITRAKDSIAYAEELGQASKVLFAIWRALTSESKSSIRISDSGGESVMLLSTVNEPMVKALSREGPVVVLDANADVDMLAALVGYPPRVQPYVVPDAAPIRRTHIVSRVANKRSWELRSRLAVKATVGSIRAMVDWVLEEPVRVVGVICPRLLRLAIELVREPGERTEKAWREAKQTKPDAVRELLGPVLEPLRDTELLLGHYGALRGLNHMAAVDALVTLGDPWPNLEDVRNEAYFVGLGAQWEARYRVKVCAELEQAHGRLRAVQRTKPGRALHIGALLPSGSAWGSVIEVRRVAQGRSPNEPTMKPDEAARLVAALGGPGKAGEALGCGRASIHRYLTGGRAIPGAVSIKLRELAIGVLETSSESADPFEVSPKPLFTIPNRSFGDTIRIWYSFSGYRSFGDSLRKTDPRTPRDRRLTCLMGIETRLARSGRQRGACARRWGVSRGTAGVRGGQPGVAQCRSVFQGERKEVSCG